MNAEERRRLIRERTQKNYDAKDQGAYIPGKSILDFDMIGGYNKDIIYRPELSERGKEVINRVDILPFIISTNNLRELKSGENTYCADIIVHRKMGPSQNDTYLCLENMYNEPCPVCEEKRMLKSKGISDDKLKDNPLSPKRRCIYNVIDLNLPKDKRVIQIFEEIHFWFEKKLLEATAFGDGKFNDFWDHEFGRIVQFIVYASKTSQGTNLNYSVSFTDRGAQYSNKVIEQTYPLDKMLIKPTYEEVKNAFHQIGTGETIEEDFPFDNPSTFNKEEYQGNIPTRDVNDDLRRPSFEETNKSPEPAPSRRNRRQQESESPKNECPCGHEFGRDNYQFQDCSQQDKCSEETFRACDNERVRLESKKNA